jgi:hypothetical protein
MAIDINIPSQVKNYANLAAFPATGTLKTIYIAEDTNKTYRWTGSAYVEISPAGATGITIGTTAITSGTVGRVLFEGTGNVVQESGNLFWDNTNGRLGINMTPGAYSLDVTGLVRMGTLRFANIVDSLEFANTLVRIRRVVNTMFLDSFNGFTFFDSTSSQDRVKIFSNGNFAINQATDAGFKLDINGTARVSGIIQANSFFINAANSIGMSSSATAIRISTNDNGANIINLNTPFFTFANNGTAINRTSGTGKWFELTSFVSFAPTSGTCTMD